MVEQIKEGVIGLKVGGPLWLAQLWMNAIFEPFMKLKKSKVQVKLPIEGYRSAHLVPNFSYKGDDHINLFYYVFTKLRKARNFKDGEINLAPFAERSIGPNWFTQDRVKTNDNA
ncbi:hypothetical protein PIB30_029723 [Stylosanthes scabra]|uniref:Uncharacterized protein n=1 Tax=Stylosanthes scabra TaxID=79078 RepID=A0ABU6X8Z1_9FABA|nr:hypothetical protein [Stylosanthes scabra]